MRERFKSFKAIVKEFYEDNEFLCTCLVMLPAITVAAVALEYFFPK